MQTGPSKRMGKRAVTVLCFIAAAFLVCVGSLAYISLIHGNEYKLKAEQNQLSDTTVSAQRGTIYDSNMKALAKSASAWLVYINPSKITSDEQRDLWLQISVPCSVWTKRRFAKRRSAQAAATKK
mgnify:CR=1 FL=1